MRLADRQYRSAETRQMSLKIRRAARQFAFAKPANSLSSLEPFAQVLILRVKTPPHRRGFFIVWNSFEICIIEFSQPGLLRFASVAILFLTQLARRLS